MHAGFHNQKPYDQQRLHLENDKSESRQYVMLAQGPVTFHLCGAIGPIHVEIVLVSAMTTSSARLNLLRAVDATCLLQTHPRK